MEKNFFPAISIIIPMYNAEKYLGECLNSLLAQTFCDYEIIVIDDCSTDKSFEIAKNYISKFKDKIKIIRRKKNSGGAGLPKNDGLKISRGEYIFFMDSDDMITKTALEELYKIAKNFDADVVQCEKFYQISAETTLEDLNSFSPPMISYPNINFVTTPTLLSDNLKTRVNDWLQRKFLWPNWSQLIRRDFFVKNNFKFTNALGEDRTLIFCFLINSKNYVLVPNVINFYRIADNSLSHKNKKVEEILRERIREVIQNFQYLDKFLSDKEFFQKHSDLKYSVLENSTLDSFYYLGNIYYKIPLSQLYDVAREEFEKSEDDNTSLAALFFGRMNFFNAKAFYQSEKINQLQKEIQKLQEQLKKTIFSLQ